MRRMTVQLAAVNPSVSYQQVVAYPVFGHRQSHGDGMFLLRAGADMTRASIRDRRFLFCRRSNNIAGRSHLNISGMSRRILFRDIDRVDDSGERMVGRCVTLHPETEQEPHDGSCRNSSDPCGYMQMSFAAPRADMQQGVFFVGQLARHTCDFLIIYSHIASVVF